ncbi:hypothetical protein [Duganella sp. Root1480D1]|uniref:hypothetical protein n=1 Tax=Duganella sp. Root1480D1 TaxID=1736471 RepID=UPI00070F2293|nr:hypothetical protein [Duganella sp. Root1480D1]
MNDTAMTLSTELAQALANETYLADCLKCNGEHAQYRFWQSPNGACLNDHWSIQCPDCGFRDSDTAPADRGEHIFAM